MVKDNKKAFGIKKILKNIWKESRKAIPLHHFSRKALMIGLWCNGSTTGFGSVCPGSNPGSPTRKSSTNYIVELFRLFMLILFSFLFLKSI